MRFWSRVFLLLGIGTVCATPAFAYIDPNAGGLLYQLLAPVIASAMVGFAVAQRWIRQLFGRIKKLFF